MTQRPPRPLSSRATSGRSVVPRRTRPTRLNTPNRFPPAIPPLRRRRRGTGVGWPSPQNFREDHDGLAGDDTRAFQQGDSAYLENIEVTARLRSNGLGRVLLEAAQTEAKRLGKKYLWLHTSENNVKAHQLFDREGWIIERSVYPPWKPDSKTRIYKKVL